MKKNATYGLMAMLFLASSYVISGCEEKKDPVGAEKTELEKTLEQMASAPSKTASPKAKKALTKSGKAVEDLAKLSADPPPPPQSKSEISRAKMEEMKQLRSKLISKREKLALTTAEFDKKIQDFVKKIRSEIDRQSMVNVTLTEAQKNRLIRNNLEAIQKAKAYQTIIATEIKLTVDGEMETTRLINHLDLDIVILDSFEDEQLDERIKQLNLTITEIQPRAKELAINPDNTSLPSLDSVWQEYFASPESPVAPRSPVTGSYKKVAPAKSQHHTPQSPVIKCRPFSELEQKLADFKAPCRELRNHMNGEWPSKTHYLPHSDIAGHVHKFDMVCKTIQMEYCANTPDERKNMIAKNLSRGCKNVNDGRTSPSEIEGAVKFLYFGCNPIDAQY